MALYHAFTNNIPNATGTLTVWNGATTATVAATDIVRPTDWNSQHIQQVTLSGHVAGNSTLSGTNIIYEGGHNITLSGTSNTIIFSVHGGGGGGGGDGGNVLAAGTQTANTTGTVLFSNANNVTFGMNNSSVMTASASFPAQSVQPAIQSISGGTTRITTGEVVFSNSNGMSFGVNGNTITGSHNGITSQSVQTQNLVSVLGSTGNISFANSNGITFGGNASTVTASHNGLTSQSNQALSASNGSFTFQTLNFSNANNVTFGTSAGGIMTASVNAQSVQTQNLVSVQGSTGNISFSNSNGVTFGFNASTITASHNGLTSQSNQAFSASGGSSAFQTLNFANSNGLTFSNSNGSVVASYTVPTQTNQTIGGYAVGNTTGASSSSTVDARSFSIQGAGAASVGFTNGSWVVSAPNAAAGNVTFSAGTTSNGLANVVFSNSNNVSFGLNGSTITASAGGGGAGATQSTFWYPQDRLITAISAPVNGSMSVQLLLADANYSATRMGILASMSPISSADNRTFSFVYSHWCGIYTNNAGTLSSVSSASIATTLGTWSSNATNSANSKRILTMPFNVNLTEGLYYIANILSFRAISTSTSSQTVAAMNMTLDGGAFLTQNNYALMGVGTNATVNEFFTGQGIYLTTTSAVPATINLTGMAATGTNPARANIALMFRA
jgi:hypothetical protein